MKRIVIAAMVFLAGCSYPPDSIGRWDGDNVFIKSVKITPEGKK